MKNFQRKKKNYENERMRWKERERMKIDCLHCCHWCWRIPHEDYLISCTSQATRIKNLQCTQKEDAPWKTQEQHKIRIIEFEIHFDANKTISYVTEFRNESWYQANFFGESKLLQWNIIWKRENACKQSQRLVRWIFKL